MWLWRDTPGAQVDRGAREACMSRGEGGREKSLVGAMLHGTTMVVRV
jgi:hypothetical protein